MVSKKYFIFITFHCFIEFDKICAALLYIFIFSTLRLYRVLTLLERSSDLSTVFNSQAAHRELVLCVLPLILSMPSLKRSIVGKPVQFYGSIQIPQSIYNGKHRRSFKAVELSSFVLLLVLMPVSIPFSYECAVYFLIKNVHFILGSVKVAEWRPPSAIT